MIARWVYRWNQNRNLKSPFRVVEIYNIELYLARKG